MGINCQNQQAFPRNSKVSTWADRSGNGNTFAQSESLNHPTYESSGGLKFDGNDFMSVALPSELQGNPAMTILIVADSQFKPVAASSSWVIRPVLQTQLFGLHESGSSLQRW